MQKTDIALRGDWLSGQCFSIEVFTSDFKSYYNMKRHYHEFFEMELILDGASHFEINGNRVYLKPFTMSLLTPMDAHTQLIQPDEKITYINIRFLEEMVSDSILNFLYTVSQPVLVSFTEENFQSSVKTLTQIRSLYLDYLQENKFGGYLLLKNNFENFLIYFIRCFIAQSDDIVIPDLSNNVFRNTIRFIRQHYREKITLDDAAKNVNLSRTYFSSYFRRIMGNTFSAYLKSFRLNIAVTLIQSTDLLLKHIAVESGFQSYEHFSQEFKRYYGKSPEQFRTQNETTSSVRTFSNPDRPDIV